MKYSWREALNKMPQQFSDALLLSGKRRKWKTALDGLSVNIDGLPNTLRQFLEDWDVKDFVAYVKGNKIRSRWQFEVSSASIFDSCARRGILDLSEFILETGLVSRKKWHKTTIDRKWVDDYLANHPELVTVKSAPGGLRAALRKAGLYDYFTTIIQSRRADRRRKNKQQLTSAEVASQTLTLSNLIRFGQINDVQKLEKFLFESGLYAFTSTVYANAIHLLNFPYGVEVYSMQTETISEAMHFLMIKTYEDLNIAAPNLMNSLMLRGTLRKIGLQYSKNSHKAFNVPIVSE